MKNQLTDTQLALIIKTALEFNASTIAAASQLYKKDLKLSAQKQVVRDFKRRQQEYVDTLEAIVRGDYNED